MFRKANARDQEELPPFDRSVFFEDGDAALEQASAVDAKIAAGKPLRRLEGLPIVIKVNVDVAGTLSTAATPARPLGL